MSALPALSAAGAAVLATACAASVLLASAAPRLGWLDAPGPDTAGRKLQRAPVPPVGGAAILLAWALAAALAREPLLPGEHPLLPASAPRELVRGAALLALLVAFALGCADDLRRGGLAPGVKLGGQLFAGALLALPVWLRGADFAPSPEALGATAACAFAGALAANALNTFDNADGAAGGTAAIGLGAGGAGLLCAGVLGALPALLLLRRRASDTPLAYLGDGGSHLLGFALWIVPGAWPALGLPLLDLGRVALARLRAGEAPWRGDRRHLAHRLQRRGLGPLSVAALLWGCASLPLLLPGPWGWSLLLIGFALLVAFSAPPRGGAWKSAAGP